MSKRLYVINLWGRGGEIYFHELTKAGYEMTYNREWDKGVPWDEVLTAVKEGELEFD